MYPRRIIIRVVTAPIGAASTRGPIRVRRNIQRLLALAFAFAISSAAAQGQLNIICSVQLPWCEAVVTQFQKDTGIKIGMTQKSAGGGKAEGGGPGAEPQGGGWGTRSREPPPDGGGGGPAPEKPVTQRFSQYAWGGR